jgi:hypothetical protein
MIQKHRILTNLYKDQKIVVELKQDYDLLEILSLKFTQKETYTSLCADYGVVCGRITANNGLGVPNVKVSIFVPVSDDDLDDPVLSALYPYKLVSDRNEDNYRYNLLPSRQQHSGHSPTGTFPDQSDIISREEVLEVYEKYYNYTVKTNSSGDFMIWGVPIGTQNIHVDLDLSDMGCFSLRPYDFIIQGVGQDKFERFYKFKSSNDIDGLPQIVSFDKTIEVFPFWGNPEICEIAITRTDFDLSEKGIKIEPITLILASSITDDNATAIKRNGRLMKEQGYKCNLQTLEGKVECVRFTGKKVIGSDGVTLYPELEYYNIKETIDENGVAMVVLPMNMDYVYTNDFGEEEISNDPNKGVATTSTARFRFGLEFNDRLVSTAKYLVPNIREFYPIEYGSPFNNISIPYPEYYESILSSYRFSDVFEDYIKVTPPENTATLDNTGYGDLEKNHKLDLILGTNNDGIPEDYFYKFIYGKVYTISSFQGSHFQTSDGKKRNDSFLGIKEIRPNVENDCASSTNYFPTNFAFRNRQKISLIISRILLFIEYISTIITVSVYEALGRFLVKFGFVLGNINNKAAERVVLGAFRIMESGQKILPLTIYPDCEDCTTDDENVEPKIFEDLSKLYYRSAEIKLKVVPSADFINLIYLSGQTPNWLNSSTSTGSTFLPFNFPNDAAKEVEATGITENQLTLLHTYTLPSLPLTPNNRFAANIFPLVGSEPTTDVFTSMYTIFDIGVDYVEPLHFYFQIDSVTGVTNVGNSISGSTTIGNYSYKVCYVNNVGANITPDETIIVKILVDRFYCGGSYEQTITLTSGGTSCNEYNFQYYNCGPNTYLETFNRILYISGSTSGYNGIPQWNSYYTGETYNNVPMIRIPYDDWAKYGGIDYRTEPNNIIDLYAVARIYDRNQFRTGVTSTEITIEEGCSKYDKFYDEDPFTGATFTRIWGEIGVDYNQPSIDYPSNFTCDNSDRFLNDSKTGYNGGFNYGIPCYDGTPFTESPTQPIGGYTLSSTVSGTENTLRLPYYAYFPKTDEAEVYFDKKTKSGLTEIRDGVITIVPVIYGDRSRNFAVIKEWYRRKKIGLLFCAGVTNFSFIDNWLNGLFYFFKFHKRLKWDNEDILDLNQRSSKYPRDLVFYNILDKNFYYRSTPYTLESNFIGKHYTNPDTLEIYYEINHPTTFYDVGVRDEFFKEICTDPRLDPTCSVIRDINVTSYQDPANIIEYGVNYRLDISNSTFKFENFFDKFNLGSGIKSMDGDLLQLFSINSEAGIEAFDLDSPQYFIYNGELMDPEDPYFISYFTGGTGNYGPTPIDLKLDPNGNFIRQCLNYRLGDYSQKVPFYLWDKGGTGFGPYDSNQDNQGWDRTKIASMKLQRIFSINDVDSTTTNYLFADGEEEYTLKPMTITHGTFVFTGNTSDALDRFELITTGITQSTAPGGAVDYVEGDLWLHVTSGSTDEPYSGYVYVVLNKTWTQITEDVFNDDASYIKDYREIFLFPTLNNYDGNKQVLSTPFLFYFGLRPGKTALDLLIKYYGPKLSQQ